MFMFMLKSTNHICRGTCAPLLYYDITNLLVKNNFFHTCFRFGVHALVCIGFRLISFISLLILIIFDLIQLIVECF